MGFNSESLTRFIREMFNNLFFDRPESEDEETEDEDDYDITDPTETTLLDEWEASGRQRAEELADKRVNEEFGGEESQ